jgi:hypothetical protein
LKATRQITYNVPLPSSPTEGERIEFFDPFEDTSHWSASTLGSHGVVDIGGDSALKVSSVESSSLGPKSSLVSINWTTTNANFASAHRLAGRFLSYDAQAKIGLDSPFIVGSWSDGDELGNSSDGLPKYFMSGIAFRLDENLNTYGLGLTRGSANTFPSPDNIENNLMPLDQTPMVTLWQQTNAGASQNWLAYSVLPGSLIFSDDVENGPGLWTSNGSWAPDTNDWHTGTTSWTDSPGSNYSPDQDTWIESESRDLSGVSSATLSFWHKYDIVSGDNGFVEISLDGGSSWDPTPLATFSGIQNSWEKVHISINGPFTANVKIRFRLQTDSVDNGPGWWIDDIKIVNKDFTDIFGGPLYQATILIRVIEAAVIDFNSGGTTPIEAGDTLSQPSGAVGTVISPPVLESGSWAGGNAAGMLWLNNTSSTAFSGGALNISGKGNNLATVTNYKDRTNLIRAYYNSANPADTGGPYTDPYDQLRLANGRGTLHWPANEGQLTDNTNDYFTLLEWDTDINTLAVPSVKRLKDENGKYTIISIDTLSTPPDTNFPYTRPELGLFALGHGALRVYFDDFGLQLYVASGSGFLTPVQQ